MNKVTAITNKEEHLQVLHAIEYFMNINELLFLFYSFAFLYGISANEIFTINKKDILDDIYISKAKVTHTLTKPMLIIITRQQDDGNLFRSLARTSIYRNLNFSCQNQGLPYSVSISTLQKTWAYISLTNGMKPSLICAQMNIRFMDPNSAYNMLALLGLEKNLVFKNEYLYLWFLNNRLRILADDVINEGYRSYDDIVELQGKLELLEAAIKK